MRTSSRIVFISHGNTTNGAELCLVETIKSLKLQGCNDIIVLLKKGGVYLEKLLTDNGAKIRYVSNNPRWVGNSLDGKQKMFWVKSTFSLFRQFSKAFRELRPDFIVTNSIVCNPASAIAAKLNRYQHGWYVHELGDADHGYKYYFGRRLTWLLVKLLSDKIIFNSKFTLRHFIKGGTFPDEKFRVIYYGVPVDRFIANETGFEKGILLKWNTLSVWKLLVSGRTVKGKGQEDIINALAILKKEFHIDNFHLTVLGRVEGEYLRTLLGLIEQHHLQAHVTMVPFTENPAPYYKEAHIGVTTSRNEAFGRITVEYMKSNMVVIGADAGGTSEIIEDSINGYLYEVGNCKQFAGILAKVMSDGSGSAEFANRARVSVEGRFNLAVHGSEVKDFLLNG